LFKRPERILIKKKLSSNIEFKRVFYSGEKKESENLKVFLLENRYNLNRPGVVVKKEVGIAVKRNKIKRRIKEAFRVLNKQLLQGYDIVVFVKKSAAKLKYLQFLKELEEIFNSYKI